MSTGARREGGFSLVEAMFGVAIVAVAFGSALQLLLFAAAANARSRLVTQAAILASRKMEELQSHGFGVAEDGADVADDGLAESAAEALTSEVPGYSDYFDSRGHALDAPDLPPAGALFVRRWSVRALDPARTILALQVRVTIGRGPAVASLSTIRSRRGG